MAEIFNSSDAIFCVLNYYNCGIENIVHGHEKVSFFCVRTQM